MQRGEAPKAMDYVVACGRNVLRGGSRYHRADTRGGYRMESRRGSIPVHGAEMLCCDTFRRTVKSVDSEPNFV